MIHPNPIVTNKDEEAGEEEPNPDTGHQRVNLGTQIMIQLCKLSF